MALTDGSTPGSEQLTDEQFRRRVAAAISALLIVVYLVAFGFPEVLIP